MSVLCLSLSCWISSNVVCSHCCDFVFLPLCCGCYSSTSYKNADDKGKYKDTRRYCSSLLLLLLSPFLNTIFFRFLFYSFYNNNIQEYEPLFIIVSSLRNIHSITHFFVEKWTSSFTCDFSIHIDLSSYYFWIQFYRISLAFHWKM